MLHGKKMLVVSAHAADYVWRSGGAIAKYVDGGADVHVVVMSFGVRGESNNIWKKGGQSYESVRDIRRSETERAAQCLGLKNIEFWDMRDYPIEVTGEVEERLVRKIRDVSPNLIITHDKSDILNPDHNIVHALVWRCSVMATSAGVLTEGQNAARQMRIFGFEPHQTEISGFRPDQFLDITSSYDKKIAAMNCFEGQKHLIEYYTQRAVMRGNHARRVSGNSTYTYAESFSSLYPLAGDALM